MESCEQAPGLNMLQHGQLVYEKFKQLHTCEHLKPFFERFSLPPPEVLARYHIYHDCGKHLCMSIDASGKKHFPNHAELSAQQFLMIFPDDGFSAALIRKDMDFHTARGDELLSLCKNPLAPILYLTAWAEIYANAEMFGGEDSESFKIKRSRLIQAGKKLLKGD